MTFWTRLARFLTPFRREPAMTVQAHADQVSVFRSRRLQQIERHQESLRHEIETAKRQKRATRHLTDQMQRLTTERLTLERAA